MYKLMNDPMNKWRNEGINEGINEWSNKWTNEWTQWKKNKKMYQCFGPREVSWSMHTYSDWSNSSHDQSYSIYGEQDQLVAQSSLCSHQ